jgi:hypothetical protein
VREQFRPGSKNFHLEVLDEARRRRTDGRVPKISTAARPKPQALLSAKIRGNTECREPYRFPPGGHPHPGGPNAERT